MSTLQQIREQTRVLINETDVPTSHFSESEINSFINQGIGFLATLIEYPRDMVEIQAEEGAGVYTLLSDTLVIRTSYFGDKNIRGDIFPLVVITEETLKTMFPNWLDETDDTKGRPKYLIMLNRRQIFVFPRPSAKESVVGKKIVLNYVFRPANLSADSDIPDLPVPYHDLLQFYAAHLCYAGKLQKADLSTQMFALFTSKIQALKHTLVKETEEGLSFQWGETDDLEPLSGSGVSNLRVS